SALALQFGENATSRPPPTTHPVWSAESPPENVTGSADVGYTTKVFESTSAQAKPAVTEGITRSNGKPIRPRTLPKETISVFILLIPILTPTSKVRLSSI